MYYEHVPAIKNKKQVFDCISSLTACIHMRKGKRNGEKKMRIKNKTL